MDISTFQALTMSQAPGQLRPRVHRHSLPVPVGAHSPMQEMNTSSTDSHTNRDRK